MRLVQSWAELVGTPFAGDCNALCWPRELAGDFAEIVARMQLKEGREPVEEGWLRGLTLSAAGELAREVLLADQDLLHAHGLEPLLDCILAYPQETEPGPVPVDVYSFHADSAPVAAETFLCTYLGAPSEGLRNEEAQQRILHPATRAALLAGYGGADDAEFAAYLAEECYDLHYAPLPGARPYSFGIGNLWRIAIAYPGCPVPPCLHRAPAQAAGGPPRLLLIS